MHFVSVQNSRPRAACNTPRQNFVRLPALQPFYTHNISKRKLLWSQEQSQSTAVIRDIFKVLPYSQTSNPVYNTVRNEIRRIDNFVKEIRRKGKKYKLNSRIHASRHYHKGNRDQAGFLYELFYFPSTSKSPRKASRICKCWFDDVVSRATSRVALRYSWPDFYWCVPHTSPDFTTLFLITYTFIINFI